MEYLHTATKRNTVSNTLKIFKRCYIANVCNQIWPLKINVYFITTNQSEKHSTQCESKINGKW